MHIEDEQTANKRMNMRNRRIKKHLQANNFTNADATKTMNALWISSQLRKENLKPQEN